MKISKLKLNLGPKSSKRMKSRLWNHFRKFSMPPHPMQPLISDNKIIRFKGNNIVKFLLDNGLFDLNVLQCMPFSDEDRAQLAQLIGYSVSGWGDLDYVTDEQVEAVDKATEEFRLFMIDIL